MTEIQQDTPMGETNLPLKELKAKKPVLFLVKKPLPIVFLVLIIFVFVLGIFFGLILKRKNNKPLLSNQKSVPSPSLSAFASPSPSAVPSTLQGKIDSLGEKLSKADLKEEKLIPPALDFNIRFKIE